MKNLQSQSPNCAREPMYFFIKLLWRHPRESERIREKKKYKFITMDQDCYQSDSIVLMQCSLYLCVCVYDWWLVYVCRFAFMYILLNKMVRFAGLYNSDGDGILFKYVISIVGWLYCFQIKLAGVAKLYVLCYRIVLAKCKWCNNGNKCDSLCGCYRIRVLCSRWLACSNFS